MDRLQQKNDLYIELGALFRPLQRLVDRPEDYDEQERAETIARYCAEFNELINAFLTFSTGQPGHNYSVEAGKFHQSLIMIQSGLVNDIPLSELVAIHLPNARAVIDAVPIPRTSAIFEAHTPCYLQGIRKGVKVTLVASPPRASASNREHSRWQDFLDISRLYASECGTANYRLVVHFGLLHDRWLVFDKKRFYNLGGSAKDAASKQYFTISVVDNSSENMKRLQEHTEQGTEYFGLNVPNHL